MTRQRSVIASIIRTSPIHLTADQIYAAARARLPSIAVGTVYRNLALMVEDGEIRRIAIADGADHYDRNCTPHDHLLCPRCGALCDLNCTPLLAADAVSTTLPHGYTYLDHELVIRALCPDCKGEPIERTMQNS